MAIKFRGRNGPFVRVQVDLSNLFGRMAKEAVRGPLGDQAGRFAERAARNIFDQFNAEPEEPFVELQQACPVCHVQIYASANGIKICLMCQRRFGIAHGMGGFAPGARPTSTHSSPINRAPPGAKTSTNANSHARPRKVRDPFQDTAKQNGFKVRRKGTKAAPPPPPPPPVEPTQQDLINRAYALLGLSEEATIEDIARRRRQMAMEGAHPDQGGSDARMAEINAAADMLIERWS